MRGPQFFRRRVSFGAGASAVGVVKLRLAAASNALDRLRGSRSCGFLSTLASLCVASFASVVPSTRLFAVIIDAAAVCAELAFFNVESIVAGVKADITCVEF